MTSTSPTQTNKLLQPVPIDLTINMTILTRFQEDYDQIVTNFVPYFDPILLYLGVPLQCLIMKLDLKLFGQVILQQPILMILIQQQLLE